MKLLLITASDETSKLVSLSVQSLGLDLIRYRHPLKAMDNIDETDPGGVIISAGDFPRHWKTLVQFIRYERSKEACPIVLLRGDTFSTDDTSKAYYMRVNGILSDKLDTEADAGTLRDILSGQNQEEKRRSRRVHVNLGNRLGFMMSNPVHHYLVPGDIKSISKTGLCFTPAYPDLLLDITVDMQVPGCSIRTGERILPLVCRVIRLGNTATLEFVSFADDGRAELESYLESLAVVEME